MVGVGRDLCGSSSPTLLPKQGHLQQTAQDFVQAGLEYLQRRRLHDLPGQPVPVLHHALRVPRFPTVRRPMVAGVFPTVAASRPQQVSEAVPASSTGVSTAPHRLCHLPPLSVPVAAPRPLGEGLRVPCQSAHKSTFWLRFCLLAAHPAGSPPRGHPYQATCVQPPFSFSPWEVEESEF